MPKRLIIDRLDSPRRFAFVEVTCCRRPSGTIHSQFSSPVAANEESALEGLQCSQPRCLNCLSALPVRREYLPTRFTATCLETQSVPSGRQAYLASRRANWKAFPSSCALRILQRSFSPRTIR